MQNEDGSIIDAIMIQDIARLQKLLESGGNPNAKNRAGTHALALSAMMIGSEGMCRLLVEHGAMVCAVDPQTKWTTLHWAAQINDTQLCKMLIECGADVNARANADMTPLLVASSADALQACSLLLDRGARLEDCSDIGATVLFKAAQTNQIGNAQLFIERGANLEAKNSIGLTPLGQASLNGHDRMCCLLVAHGAECRNEPIYKQLTKKQAAARGGFPELLIKLLADAPDSEPGDELDSLKALALRFGRSETVAVLDAAMAHRTIASIADIANKAKHSC